MAEHGVNRHVVHRTGCSCRFHRRIDWWNVAGNILGGLLLAVLMTVPVLGWWGLWP